MIKLSLPESFQGLLSKLGQMPPVRARTFVVLAAAALLAILYLIYSLMFVGQVYPRVLIGDYKFSGLEHSEAVALLDELNQTLDDKAVVLKYQDNSHQILPKEVDWQVDSKATADKLLAVGRANNKLSGLWQQLRAPFSRTVVEPVVSYDEQSLESFITIVSEEVDQPAVDATAEIAGEDIKFTADQVGSVIDKDTLTKEVIGHWLSYRGGELNVVTVEEMPEVILGDEQSIREQVRKLSDKKIRVQYFQTERQLTRGEIRQLVDFVGDDPDKSPSNLEARFTEQSTKEFLNSLAEKENKPALEPRLTIREGSLAVAEPSRQGQVIDVLASSEKLFAGLIAQEDAAATISLVTVTQDPVINESNLATLGIKERIGFGVTDFAGSPTNRRLNILNGVKILQSALIKPGGEFSTVNTLGAVDASTGFLPELVIKENRTIPEYGGGLCQVSTTLFRSVLDAGLKVTARQNHSYRVSYYEPPLGLDATIYLPRPDFKFLNDTPGHILVQGRVEGNKVYFELWGTSDGRKSTIGETQIISTTPAGEPIYADTDTLFVGETKQIEKPHDGAVTTVVYSVARDGKTIHTQTFRSVYKAWPARFLVGIKPLSP